MVTLTRLAALAGLLASQTFAAPAATPDIQLDGSLISPNGTVLDCRAVEGVHLVNCDRNDNISGSLW
ncbi:uncharacterized protein CTHT_0040130 [Thermochaetoides thermophila DSM 1495]|uniref:Cyanovirin-N domain-containing protein n=1 Tax=Chaetomium thermophilum (strain DSM 1495 / CBS 144.50 / IMI 039719) TaxID=759272 RepID=G0S8S1_CHATD|nr:hypothetical protein CTHT_0040130 [Thermochaetoides thermophila DSM 1495]EGS20274.1 hypothetical protein CTHT_0040130 [Thermochaetoides thermophila DSM 1495]